MQARLPFPSLLRVPLIQFLIIGALLFAADRYLTLQRDDPRQIIVDAERVAWLVDVFQEGQGRAPNREEVENLIVKWSQNEIFYREARAMGLDQGDEMMRSRLILKMRNVLFNRITQEEPDAEDLEAWFELNRDKYDVPPRYTFEQFPLRGVVNAQKAQDLAMEINADPALAVEADGLRSYPRRPAKNIEVLFGEDGRKTLTEAPVGQWNVVRSERDWHLARVTERHTAIPAQFEDVKSRVIRDFREIAVDLQLSEMAADIADKYETHLEFEAADVERILAEAGQFVPQTTTADTRSLKARAGASNIEAD